MIENMSNLLNSSEVANETLNTENDINLAQEATVNYSENSWDISKLIDYYEDKTQSEFNPNQSILAESPSKALKSSHFVMINCRESFPHHQRRSLDELSSITVSYDWKDVSQMTATQELEENIIEVSPSILALTNMELKDRLISLGEKPGPISDTTLSGLIFAWINFRDFRVFWPFSRNFVHAKFLKLQFLPKPLGI